MLAREVLGHPARIAGRVRSIGIAPGTFNPRYTGLPRTRLGQPALGKIPLTLYAYSPADSSEQHATINPGDQIAATGTLSRAELTEEPNGHGVRLNVDLIDRHASRYPHSASNRPANLVRPFSLARQDQVDLSLL